VTNAIIGGKKSIIYFKSREANLNEGAPEENIVKTEVVQDDEDEWENVEDESATTPLAEEDLENDGADAIKSRSKLVGNAQNKFKDELMERNMSSADEEKKRCFHIKMFVYSLEEREEQQVSDFWIEKTD